MNFYTDQSLAQKICLITSLNCSLKSSQKLVNFQILPKLLETCLMSINDDFYGTITHFYYFLQANKGSILSLSKKKLDQHKTFYYVLYGDF